MATISDDNVVISVEVDSKDAEGKLKVLGKTINDVGENSEKSFTKSQASLVTLASAVQLAQAGFGLLNGALQSTFNLLPEAGRVDALARSFESLQESAGNNATQALEKFRQTSQGLVSDLDLIQSSNRAVLLGLPTEGFQEAAGAAIQLGRAMGINATQAINDFATGVGRGSALILDNLGIIVDTEGAYRSYAESLDRTVASLTEQEKKLAFANAAYKAITESAKNTAQVNLNASDAFQVLQVSLQNLGTELLRQLSNNEDLAEAFLKLSKTVNDFDTSSFVSFIADAISIVAEAVNSVTGFINLLKDLKGFIDSISPSSGIKDLVQQAEEFDNILLTLPNNLNKLNQSLSQIETVQDLERANKLWVSLKETVDNNTVASARYGESLNKLGDKLKAVDNSKLKLNEETEREIELTDEAKNAAKKYAEELDKLRDTISSTTRNEINDFQRELEQLGITSRESLAGQAEAVENLAIEYVKLGKLSLPEATKAIDDFVEANKKAQEQIVDDFAKQIQENAKNIAKAREDELRAQEDFNDEVGELANRGIEESLRTLFNGGNSADYNEIAKQTVGDLTDAYVTELTGSPLAGDVARVVSEEIVDGLFDAFGGKKNAAANLRQGLQKFLNNTIKDLKLNISDIFVNDGFGFQLPNGRNAFDSITDPLTGEITTAAEQGLADLNIPQDLLNTFDGVGRALALALGEGGDAALEVLNQFGTLLAINFQDAKGLNDLQIILQGAGLSAEQLTEQLEQAFLLGDLAAEEFLGSLSATRDLFAQGIPSAVGATDLAFQNLVSDGLETGRQAMDALGDIAVEATEKGINGFNELRADLIASGKSVTEVDKLLQALANNGIDSIEELQGITAEQTAGVVASLNNLGFGFEEVSRDVKALAEEIDRIKSKKVDIEFNVKTNYDTNTQQLLNNTVTSQYIPQVGNA